MSESIANQTTTGRITKVGEELVFRFDNDTSPIPKVPHTGGCHCGAVRFKFLHEVLEAQPTYHMFVKSCDCSICERNGYLHVYPYRHEIEWISGWDKMSDYKFATGKKVNNPGTP